MKRILAVALMLVAGWVQAAPKVAVSDLAYEERVREYIRVVAAESQAQATAFHAHANSRYAEVEGTYSYIERGELRRFTGDIKGQMLRSGLFELVQGKPFTAKENEALFDVVERIRQGYYDGADYVLFGVLTAVDVSNDVNEIQHTDGYSNVFGMTLVAEFSLIDTRTLAVISAFSALGEGKDVKLINARDIAVRPNRGRVVKAVSETLGADVARQLIDQLGSGPAAAAAPAAHRFDNEPAQILR